MDFDVDDELEKICRTILVGIGLSIACVYSLKTTTEALIVGELDSFTGFWGLAATILLGLLAVAMGLKATFRLNKYMNDVLDVERYPILRFFSLIGGIIALFVPIISGYQALHLARFLLS